METGLFIKFILLFVFFGTMICVGIYTHKHAKNVQGFILGGRNVGPWLTAFAYGTSYFSAVVFVGYAGQFGWRYGVASTWIGIGNAAIGSLLAWIVLGRRTRIMTHHLQASTMPAFFGERFQSRGLKIFASLIVFVFLIPYTASVYNGLSRLFGVAFSVPYSVCVIGMAILTGIYVILGGYMATAVNDFIQGIIMLVGIFAVIINTLSNQGGFMMAIKKLSEIPSDVPATMGQLGAFVSFFGTDPLGLLSVILLTSFGTWGLPQMVQKFYAIKNEKVIKKGAIISTIFALVVAGGSYFLGAFGRLFDNSSIYNANGSVIYDSIIPYIVSTLPNLLIGIVVVLVLSASMSTLSSLVLTSSTTLTLDLIKDTLFPKMKEHTQLLLLRLFIIVFIVFSVVIALDPKPIIAQLMGISWGALAGSFLAPFLLGLYWKKTSAIAVWCCFFTGVGITVSNMIFGYIGSSINAGVLAMIVGFIVVPMVSLITPNLSKEKIDDMFCCYNDKVEVSMKENLPDFEENNL